MSPPPSDLVLILKHVEHEQIPQIEHVSLTQTQAPAVFDTGNLQIFQSCNGLFLCFSQPFKTYYIYNPATTELVELPRSAYMENHVALNLALDPGSTHYKIICIQRLDPEKSLYKMSIYSSENQTLTFPTKPFVAPRDIDFRNSIYCNGFIHWTKRTPRGIYFNLNGVDELVREMPEFPLLDDGIHWASCEYFGESEGHLYCAVAAPQFPFLKIFQLKEDYSDWSLKFRIDMEALAMDFPSMGRRSNDFHPHFPLYEGDVVSVVQDHDSKNLKVILAIPNGVIAYSHQTKSAERLCNLQSHNRPVWYRVYSSYQVF